MPGQRSTYDHTAYDHNKNGLRNCAHRILFLALTFRWRHGTGCEKKGAKGPELEQCAGGVKCSGMFVLLQVSRPMMTDASSSHIEER